MQSHRTCPQTARGGQFIPAERAHEDRVAERRRAIERYRRIALTGLGTAGARGISIVTMMASIPLCLSYLGPERCGLWMTITSLLALAGIGDLGIGNGLMNAVAAAHGRNDRRMARRLIASAGAALVGTSIVLLMAFVLSHLLVDWSAVFNVTSVVATKEIGPAMVALALCVIINIPLSLVGRIQLAYQQGYLNSIWESVGNLLALAALVLALKLAVGLPWLVLAVCGAPLVAALLNAGHLFGWHSPWLRPGRSDARWSTAIAMLQYGGLFFVLQLSIVVHQISDTLIVAHLFGPDRLPELAAPQRLFALPIMGMAVVLTPLWPAYAESIARGDRIWVRKALVRSLALALAISSAAAVVLVGWGDWILDRWVGPSIPASQSMLVALGFGLVLQALGSTLATLLNAAHVVKFQIIVATLLTVGKVGLSYWLVNWLGLAGIAWATTIAYGILVLVPYLARLPRLLHQLDSTSALVDRPLLALDPV